MTKLVMRAALLSCAALVTGPAVANHSWGNYHWGRTANPFTLRVLDAVNGTWDSYLDGAIADWNASTVLQLSKQDGSTYNPRRCRAVSGKILACNASYGQNGWLGLASIWANGDHITQATTKLNDTYFNTATYNTSAWRSMVTCQEIAHDFGLDHQDENFNNANLGTCMDYTNNPATNQHPNAHDFEQLVTIYSHLDGSNTYSAAAPATNFGIRTLGQRPPAPGASADEAGDSPAEWGRAIHRDRQGRPDVFLQELGGGRRKLTHVFWAMGEGPGRQ